MVARTRRYLGAFIVMMSVAVFAIMIYGMVNVSGFFAFLIFLWLAVVCVGVVMINSGFSKKDPETAVSEPPRHEEPAPEPAPGTRQGNGSGYCPSCGAPLNAADSFCGVCGRRL